MDEKEKIELRKSDVSSVPYMLFIKTNSCSFLHYLPGKTQEQAVEEAKRIAKIQELELQISI